MNDKAKDAKTTPNKPKTNEPVQGLHLGGPAAPMIQMPGGAGAPNPLPQVQIHGGGPTPNLQQQQQIQPGGLLPNLAALQGQGAPPGQNPGGAGAQNPLHLGQNQGGGPAANPQQQQQIQPGGQLPYQPVLHGQNQGGLGAHHGQIPGVAQQQLYGQTQVVAGQQLQPQQGQLYPGGQLQGPMLGAGGPLLHPYGYAGFPLHPGSYQGGPYFPQQYQPPMGWGFGQWGVAPGLNALHQPQAPQYHQLPQGSQQVCPQQLHVSPVALPEKQWSPKVYINKLADNIVVIKGE